MHLFDINIPGGIRFQESEVLIPGNEFFTFDTSEYNIMTLDCSCSNPADIDIDDLHSLVQGWSGDML